MKVVSLPAPAERLQHVKLLSEVANELSSVPVIAMLVSWACNDPDGPGQFVYSRALGSDAELVYLAERFKQRVIAGAVTHVPVPPTPAATGGPAAPVIQESTESTGSDSLGQLDGVPHD
jgi:hypothetical protein